MVVTPLSRISRSSVKNVGFERILAGLNRGDGGTRAAAMIGAGLIHVVVFAVGTQLPAQRTELPPQVTEVELAAPPVPPPPPPPPPPPEPEPETPTALPTAPMPANAPPVARAGNVVTAKSDSPAPSDAVDFVTDPDGRSFGSGVVARGGTLERGVTPTPVAPRPGPALVRGSAAPSGDAPTAPENLSRAALLEEPNPCAGLYPPAANADSGLVTLSLVVRPGGDLASANVINESPPGEGFGAAARACLGKKRFTPARDRAGRPVTAALSIRVRFTR